MTSQTQCQLHLNCHPSLKQYRKYWSVRRLRQMQVDSGTIQTSHIKNTILTLIAASVTTVLRQRQNTVACGQSK
jgi:hypothetical protein